MSPRSIRRAAERRAKKIARKAARQAEQTSIAAAVASETSPEPIEQSIEVPETEASHIESPREHKPRLSFELKELSAITPAQLAANRANAQLSTGPRTTAGKAKSSLNAVKSGLTGHTVLLPTDDLHEYAAFLAGYQHDFAPVGQAECELVQSVADTEWRLRRIRALEFALYAHGHAQFEEAFQDYPEDIRYNMIQLQTDMTYEKQLRNYHIHEARLHRRRDKDMAELRRLQAERKSNQHETEEDFSNLAVGAVLGYQNGIRQASATTLPDQLSDLDAIFAPKSAGTQAIQGAQFKKNGLEFSTGTSLLEKSTSETAERSFELPEAA